MMAMLYSAVGLFKRLSDAQTTSLYCSNNKFNDMKRILTIAGSDSGGGAGIQADLKTFHQFGCYGMSAITAVTVQNTLGVFGFQNMASSSVAEQIEAVVKDIGVDAVKIGMLGTLGTAEAVAAKLHDLQVPNLVLDPIICSSSGVPLLSRDALAILVEKILPLTLLVTPNLSEAAALSGIKVRNMAEMKDAAHLIFDKGAANVLVKGGHLPGAAIDLLFDGATFTEYAEERIEAKNTHGTGCTYSAAITACLGIGYDLVKAVSIAKKFVTKAIRSGLAMGSGVGPVNHFVAPDF